MEDQQNKTKPITIEKTTSVNGNTDNTTPNWQNFKKPRTQETSKNSFVPHIWHRIKLGRLKQIRSWNNSYKINAKGNGQPKKRTKPKHSLTRNQKTKNGTQIEKRVKIPK